MLAIGNLLISEDIIEKEFRFRPDFIIHYKNKKKIIESWNFEIRKVTYDDHGLYECYIKLNSKQKLKANVYLIVKSEAGLCIV